MSSLLLRLGIDNLGGHLGQMDSTMDSIFSMSMKRKEIVARAAL
jgi:hypothetical protein